MNGVEFVKISVNIAKDKLDEYRRLIIDEYRHIGMGDHDVDKFAKCSYADILSDAFFRSLIDLRDRDDYEES